MFGLWRQDCEARCCPSSVCQYYLTIMSSKSENPIISHKTHDHVPGLSRAKRANRQSFVFRNEAKVSYWASSWSHAERTIRFPITCGRYAMHVSHYRLRRATNITLHGSKFCPVHHTRSSSNQRAPSAWAVEPGELPTVNRDTITGGQHRTCGSSGPSLTIL
jgi:hypothetical protein